MTNPTYQPLETRLQDDEPPYRNEAEARIGRALDDYDIPFFYRQARLIYHDHFHEAWYPAFTLPTYNGLVVEYAERTETHEAQARRATYHANYIPAVIVGPQALQQPYWEASLVARIETAYENGKSRTHDYRRAE